MIRGPSLAETTPPTLVLYDVSSTYFEGRTCELPSSRQMAIPEREGVVRLFNHQ